MRKRLPTNDKARKTLLENIPAKLELFLRCGS